jgi:uroporphyrinogen-III decarboxylase
MSDMEALYQQRLRRFVTALNNKKPDRVPIRPFAAEFTCHAGFTCQQVTQHYPDAFEAMVRCCKEYDWDAVPASMVYVWTGITDAAGVKYYGVPGVHIPADRGFQYREPPEEAAFMREDEYDRLIDDPTAFLYEVWLPRASRVIAAAGEPVTFRHNAALVSAAMAMTQYFNAFGPHCARLRSECGMPGAIAGIFKAPFDIIGDKLRGYVGLTMDMYTQPEKVLKACEALMPHLHWVAAATADPASQLPIGYWMHRGCVPFVRPDQFASHYWPTVRPIIEELWRGGHQTMFYAEGSWDAHLDAFRELPERSIVYHIDRGDPLLTHRKLHDKFALSGGVNNVTLAIGSPEQVRKEVRTLIEAVGKEGGYIMDASAIMQNDTRPENMRALVEAAREFGVYDAPDVLDDLRVVPGLPRPEVAGRLEVAPDLRAGRFGGRAPGVCVPWEEHVRDDLSGPIQGSAELAERVWRATDAGGAMFVWQMLLSF